MMDPSGPWPNSCVTLDWDRLIRPAYAASALIHGACIVITRSDNAVLVHVEVLLPSTTEKPFLIHRNVLQDRNKLRDLPMEATTRIRRSRRFWYCAS